MDNGEVFVTVNACDVRQVFHKTQEIVFRPRLQIISIRTQLPNASFYISLRFPVPSPSTVFVSTSPNPLWWLLSVFFVSLGIVYGPLLQFSVVRVMQETCISSH